MRQVLKILLVLASAFAPHVCKASEVDRTDKYSPIQLRCPTTDAPFFEYESMNIQGHRRRLELKYDGADVVYGQYTLISGRTGDFTHIYVLNGKFLKSPSPDFFNKLEKKASRLISRVCKVGDVAQKVYYDGLKENKDRLSKDKKDFEIEAKNTTPVILEQIRGDFKCIRGFVAHFWDEGQEYESMYHTHTWSDQSLFLNVMQLDAAFSRELLTLDKDADDFISRHLWQSYSAKVNVTDLDLAKPFDSVIDGGRNAGRPEHAHGVSIYCAYEDKCVQHLNKYLDAERTSFEENEKRKSVFLLACSKENAESLAGHLNELLQYYRAPTAEKF